jgi:large subunit ribosomal protein L21
MVQQSFSKGMALAATQAVALQQDTVAGIPWWVIILIVLLVLIGVVIWVMYYQGQKAGEAKAGHAEVTQPAVPAVPAPVRTEPVAIPSAPAKPDDLVVIEGIGPKISGLLQAAGITTFAQLANTDVSRLKQILADAKLSHLADPATWPEQAKLAAAGDKAGLQKLQDQLKGGRRA